MTDETDDPDTAELRVEEAFVCEDCGKRWYYTRNRCPRCGSDVFSTYTLGDGELIAHTETHVTPSDVRSPNVLGLARFGEVQLIAQLADDDPSLGDRVTFAGSYQLREGDTSRHPRLTHRHN